MQNPVGDWPERVRPQVARLIDSLGTTPALVLGRRADVLRWNRIAHALLAAHLPFDAPEHPGRRPNLVRMVFLDRRTRALYADWPDKARDSVAYLRIAAGRRPDDTDLIDLVTELYELSAEFAILWAEHPVGDCAHRMREYRHPLVGPLVLRDEALNLADGEGQRVVVFHAEPGTESAAALERLGRLAEAAG